MIPDNEIEDTHEDPSYGNPSTFKHDTKKHHTSKKPILIMSHTTRKTAYKPNAAANDSDTDENFGTATD